MLFQCELQPQGGEGSEVRVWPLVIETSFPSMLPVTFTSSRKFALITGWRVWPCTSETSFPSTRPLSLTSPNNAPNVTGTLPWLPWLSTTPFSVTVVYCAFGTPARSTMQSLPPLAGSLLAVPALEVAAPHDSTGFEKWNTIT